MGAPLPRDGPGTPEGSRKWASLSFYRGQGRSLHCGSFRKAQCTNQHVFRPSHTQFTGGAELDEDGGGVTASKKKKKKAPLVPSSCHRCSFCPARISQAGSVGPRG